MTSTNPHPPAWSACLLYEEAIVAGPPLPLPCQEGTWYCGLGWIRSGGALDPDSESNFQTVPELVRQARLGFELGFAIGVGVGPRC